MSIGGALARGQRAAEAAMTDRFIAYSPNGTTTDGDGYEVAAYTDEGTTVGKVQGPSMAASDAATRTVTVGGVVRPVLEAGLHIPVSALLDAQGRLKIKAGLYGVGWEFECTSVGTVSDASLVGRRYLVVGVPAKSFATARRLDVVEVAS